MNYYAPNGKKEQVEVLTQIEDFLSKIDYDQNTAMIWGGDFNVTCDNNNNNNIYVYVYTG